ncbi:leucine-rich repeat protein, partial [Ruminococcus albus]
MRKKIIAGVAAMLMVASCVPANTNFGFSATTPITASAAETKRELEDENVTLKMTKTGDIEITSSDLFEFMGVNNGVSTLDIDMSRITDDVIDFAGGSLSGKKVILKPPTNVLKNDVNLARINFKDSLITDVGASFASGCTTLQIVSFGDKINTIGNSAFKGCDHLQGTPNAPLDLSNIVTIEASAFSGASELISIKFSDNISSIGNNAFSGDIAIRNLNFPENLLSIGDSAFSGCKNLESIVFNSDDMLNNIGTSAFMNCTSLTAVNVVGFSYNRLPNGTLDLKCGPKVFKGCTSLQNFTWPSDFKWIPEETFCDCTSLTRFKFEGDAEGSSCIEIQSGAFDGCTSLTSIELPDANTVLGDQVFYNCKNLKQVVVSDQLTNVGKSAFAGCWVLTLYPRSDLNKTKNKIVLPQTWKLISGSTFSNCEGVTQVDITYVEGIGESAFNSCNSLESINIPDKVTTLYDNTFCDCTELKDVVVSRNLTVLGKSATTTDPKGCVFKGCTSLETLTPSNATKIPYTIQFPASLGGVQKSCFEDCPSFKYINFAENSHFSVLGESAFSKCTGLLGSNEVGNSNNTILMPAGVTDIFKNAFYGCTSLKNIEFLGNVSTIGVSAFQKCTSLEEITMNDTIEQVRDSAFADCTALKHMPHTKESETATAFSHINTISASTFKNCTSLEDAYIPKNVSAIKNDAFYGCKAMTKVLWEEGSALANIGSSAFSGAEKLAVFTSKDNTTDTVFPHSLTKIDANAFTKTALTKIIFHTPDNGDKLILGKAAFSENVALDTADFSNSNIQEIPASCFSKDTYLKTVIIPEKSLTSIGDSAFYYCNYLHTLKTPSSNEGEYTIPQSVTSIGSKAFEDNFCMQTINLPATTSYLHMSMSMFNIDLRKFKFEQIAEKGFTPLECINVDKNNLEYKSVDGILYNQDMTILYNRPIYKQDPTYVVPDTVETIKSYACVNGFLEKVTLNENLKLIEDKAFNDCHSLTSVDFGHNGTVQLGTKPNNLVFGKDKGKITLYGTSNSTAQEYADKNSSKVEFVDNDRVAAKLEILSAGGKVISDKITLAYKGKNYSFGCKQTTASGAEAADTLTWSSSEVEVATIDDTGKVTFKSKGTTTITVKNANGTAVASITLIIADEGGIDDFKLGDVNGDGVINVTDITKVAAHVKGKKLLDAAAQKRADVNNDGKINVSDISKIAAHVKGKKLL